LEDKVKFSTIHLELSQIVERQVAAPSFLTRIQKGFKNGFDLFLDTIVWLVNLWPFVLLLLGIWLLIRRRRWSFRKKKGGIE
jgi:uncharacterized membrane protein